MKPINLAIVMRPCGVVALFLISYIGVIWLAHGRDSQEFVTLGRCFSSCMDNRYCAIPAGATLREKVALEGYDGQFAYYIARQPQHAPLCLDVPAYRYQRIGLPFLGRVITLGEVRWLPWAFVLLNGLALVISTYLLEKLLALAGVSVWLALVYGLFVGVVLGVRLSTSEPLAYGWVIGAIWANKQAKTGLYPLLLALAALTKETTLVVIAGFIFYHLHQREWRMALQVSAIALLPFVIWQAYLYDWLGAWGIGSGGANATGFEWIPLGGVLKLWTEGNVQIFLVRGVIFLGVWAILPTIWALFQTGRDLWQGDSFTLNSSLLLSSAAMMLFVPFSTYREYLGILRFLPPLVLFTVLYSAERGLARPLRYSTFWLVLLIFLGVG